MHQIRGIGLADGRQRLRDTKGVRLLLSTGSFGSANKLPITADEIPKKVVVWLSERPGRNLERLQKIFPYMMAACQLSQHQDASTG